MVGGIVVALMGFEMLYGGQSSRTRGAVEAADPEAADPDQNGLVMPLAVPLMAGPGAITTVITMSSATDDAAAALLATFIGVAVVSVLVWFGFAVFGNWFAKLSPSATAMLARIGGLLLATIGMQLALGGIRTFYSG